MQLYDRSTLINRMIQAVRARTNAITYFGPGPFRAFLYAVAAEIQHLYYQLFKVEQKLDLLTATGDALDNYGSARGLTRLGASQSSVLVQVQANGKVAGVGTIEVRENGLTVWGTDTDFGNTVEVGDTLVAIAADSTNRALVTAVYPSEQRLTVATSMGSPSGVPYWIIKAKITVTLGSPPLRFSASTGAVFEAVETLTLLPTYSGSETMSGVVRARSTGYGVDQNVAANTIRAITNATLIPQVTATATNPAAAQGGADAESDASFRTRIITLFAGLNQGTPAFYESQVRLANSSVIRVFLARGSGLGEVLVYCLTSNGAPLTTNEKQSLTTALAAVVPVQTTVTVRDMILQPINVSFTTTLSAGATVTSVAASLADSYRELLDWRIWPFGKAVQADDLLRIASATNGVDSLSVATFSPVNDTPMPAATLPRIGTITVTDGSTGNSTSVSGVVQNYPRLS